MANIQGIEQGRAKFAYNCALEGSKINKKKEYKSYVRKIPMMIKTDGLGNTYAFVKAKSDKDKSKPGYAYNLIYEQTASWLKICSNTKNIINLKDNDDLVEKIIEKNSQEYRALTVEVLAFFNWLRRFADGLIEGE